jgi:ParB family chromosome partitioning protein
LDLQIVPLLHKVKMMREQAIFYIEVDKITPNPYQPRRDFNEEALKELADSIREYGILEPLIVTRLEEGTPSGGITTKYQLIAGERRLMAAKLVGLSTVPAIIREGDDERVKFEIALIENLQREDLNPMERARAFARLSDEFGLAQREIAIRIGKSREWVANSMRLLALPLEAQKALEEGKITEGHARVILALADAESRREILELIISKNLTVRQAFEEASSRGLRKGSTPATRPKISAEEDPILKNLRAKLEETLGTKVMVRSRGEGGEISITYHSPEEFDAIIAKITGSTLH